MPNAKTAKAVEPDVSIELLIADWKILKERIDHSEKQLEKLKPRIAAKLGEADSMGVKLADTEGTYVIKKVRQDRRKPDLRALTEKVITAYGTIHLEGRTETVLTEAGAAELLEGEVIGAEDLEAVMVGKVVEFVEVRLKKDAAPE